jgi:RNA polymerase sigma factor (sigma-70 family)
MDLEPTVRRARQGEVRAFVELTLAFQHFAFGSALVLVHDSGQAEDIVQEAFLAAWSALPRLADPAAFPGWLRSIVRHHAFRSLRGNQSKTVPLAAALDVRSEAPTPDQRLVERQQLAAALGAIGKLPLPLREAATLFFVHECSHQDIATFLGLSVTTVNNRLHAARSQLRLRRLIMVKDTLEAHALPDEFANRIGRLVAARDGVVEALFDPAAQPDILTELAVSDEARRQGIKVQVVQRPGGGLVRGVAVAPFDTVPRGSTVLSSGQHTNEPINKAALERLVPLLAGQRSTCGSTAKLLETGIKVIDVLCPLVAGSSVAIAGELGAGITVVMEEVVRRLSESGDTLSLFVFLPPASSDWPRSLDDDFSFADELKKDGYSEGTLGGVQTFFFRAEGGPWTPERLSMLEAVDVVIHLSRAQGKARIYPTVEPLTSRSRWLETPAVSNPHAALARRIREALAILRDADSSAKPPADTLLLERARRLRVFFGQPFFDAEAHTHRPGAHIALTDALKGCREILDGRHDDLPVEAFVFTGGIAEIRARASAGLAPLAPPWSQPG